MQRLGASDVKYVKGIGEATARVLGAELDITTMRDLAYYFPFRYIDRSRYYRIGELTVDLPYVQIRGTFLRFTVEGEGARQRLVGLFSDGYRTMETVWFSRVKTMRDAYSTGVEYVIFGKPTVFNNTWSMAHPEVDIYKPEAPQQGLYGVYNLTDKVRKRGIGQRQIRRWMENLMANPNMINCKETLPEQVVNSLGLMTLRKAIHAMHFPHDTEELNKARERLKFEELFYVQLHILRFSRERGMKVVGQRFPRVGQYFHRFYSEVLPYALTGAQKRVVSEIQADMVTGRQMNRLLQGDVGSGKTLVAFLSMLLAVDNGAQASLMAPTEILATQHYESLKPWCDAIGLRIELLKGSTRVKKRREIHEALENGSLNILVGTHALIEEKVKFDNLGLAVIDEQHRFGVAQRARLWEKNSIPPHMLVMTATPIPRTLAMTVYGDLDVSVIDELPPGRKPIQTQLHYQEEKEAVYRLVADQLKLGRQVYFVYPLIKENEKLALRSLEAGRRVVEDIYGKYFRIAYVHGQMKPEEKDHQMELFASGEAQILVATTVIEVGVNVPNATVMVIENAERFGLSQLHQLRGRVGRGADLSFCLLVGKNKMGADSRRRLKLMVETTDGFRIAEEDMNMRGPGDMDGTLQSGLAFDLKVANLATDGATLTLARRCAASALDHYPHLCGVRDDGADNGKDSSSDAALSLMARELTYRFGRSFDWSRIS